MTDFYWTPDVFLMLTGAAIVCFVPLMGALLVSLRIKRETVHLYRQRCRDYQQRAEAAEAMVRRIHHQRIYELTEEVIAKWRDTK